MLFNDRTASNFIINVIESAIQAHGGSGVTQDFPLASHWANARTLRIVDGLDEVHRRDVGRLELKKY